MKILLVDDCEDALSLGRFTLRAEGYELDTAASGEAALEALDSSDFDMVLLDLLMPGLDGFGVLERMASQPRWRSIPVVVASASDELEHRTRALELGAVDYITKPYSAEELRARTGAVLRARTLQDELAQRDSELRATQSRFEAAASSSQDGAWECDLATGDVFSTPRFAEILGLDVEGPVPEAVWVEQVHEDDRARLRAELDACRRELVESLDVEVRLKPDEDDTELDLTRWIRCRGKRYVECEGASPRVIVLLCNVTQLRRNRDALRQYAEVDTLTGLLNRSTLRARLAQAIVAARRGEGHGVGLLFLDLDRFKLVNEGLGHDHGDRLLRTIGARLCGVAAEGNLVARCGGDLFAVLLTKLNHPDEAEQAAARVIEACSETCSIDGQDVVVTTSVGVVVGQGDSDPDELLRQADTALYAAKDSARGGYALFHQSMQERAVRRLEVERELRVALERDQLKLVYQPIVASDSGELVGAEALMRWHHPQWGMVSPGEFIEVAEDIGHIVVIGDWAIREACRQIKAWDDAGLVVPRMNVNLAKRQMAQPGLLNAVASALEATGVEPHRLCLEVTETTVTDAAPEITQRLEEVRASGVHLAMDDFGTGQSSLVNLHRFPIDTLKIDRAFVSNLEAEHSFSAVLHAIITLAQNLGLGVVAEGVETTEQLAQLQTMDCDHLQGFLFSKPLSAEAFVAWAKHRSEATELRAAG